MIQERVTTGFRLVMMDKPSVVKQKRGKNNSFIKTFAKFPFYLHKNNGDEAFCFRKAGFLQNEILLKGEFFLKSMTLFRTFFEIDVFRTFHEFSRPFGNC